MCGARSILIRKCGVFMEAVLILKAGCNTDLLFSVGDLVEVFHFEFGNLIGNIIGFSDKELTLCNTTGMIFSVSYSLIFAIEKCV